MALGWRQLLADVVSAIRATHADAVNAGSMTAPDFLKLSGLRPAADWPITTVRTFLLDPAFGSDSNVGYSDAAGPYTPISQAKKTFAGLAAVLPVNFAGRKFRLIMAQAVYTEGLEQLINGATGIGSNSLIRGTSTNSTAGATAFADDAADRIYQGWQTATGMNGPGYKPTGAPTTTVVQCLTAAGGAPAFGAEPALPAGARVRYDAATPTVALRNACRSIIQVTGTDTLTLDSALPAVPATGGSPDIFYIEMGGLAFPAQSLSIEPTGVSPTLQLCGFYTNSSLTLGAGDWRMVGVKANAVTVTGATQSGQQTSFVETTTAVAVAIGGCVRSETNALYNRCVFASLSSGASYTAGILSLSGIGSGSATSIVAHDISNGGIGPGAFILSNVRTFNAGTAGLFLSAPLTVAGITCTGAGAKPAIGFNSFVAQGYMAQIGTTGTVSGSTGNNDVGFDSTGATGCTFVFGVTPTLTGALGDVRVAGGSILTWAQVLSGPGYIDANGNRFVRPGAVVGVGPLGTFWYTQVIDLTTTGVYTICPPFPGRARLISFGFELKSVGGTRSVAPTFSIGTNSPNYDDVAASQVGGGALLTQAAETNASAATTIAPGVLADMSANGLMINVTAGATGAGIVLTARFFVLGGILPV